MNWLMSKVNPTPAAKQTPSITEEAGLEGEWTPIEVSPIIPNMTPHPGGIDVSSGPMPPNLGYQPALVATGYSAKTAPIDLMPLPANPLDNAKSQGVAKIIVDQAIAGIPKSTPPDVTPPHVPYCNAPGVLVDSPMQFLGTQGAFDNQFLVGDPNTILSYFLLYGGGTDEGGRGGFQFFDTTSAGIIADVGFDITSFSFIQLTDDTFDFGEILLKGTPSIGSNVSLADNLGNTIQITACNNASSIEVLHSDSGAGSFFVDVINGVLLEMEFNIIGNVNFADINVAADNVSVNLQAQGSAGPSQGSGLINMLVGAANAFSILPSDPGAAIQLVEGNGTDYLQLTTIAGSSDIHFNSVAPTITFGIDNSTAPINIGPVFSCTNAPPTGSAYNGSLHINSTGNHAAKTLLYVYDTLTSSWIGIA